MSRGPTRFRQRDLTAAIRAARAAGLRVARVEVDQGGKITIVTAEQLADAAADHAAEREKNEWDEVLG